MNLFSLIASFFRAITKVFSTVEDTVDIAKGKTVAWKANAMDDLREELDGRNLTEVNDFYEDLYATHGKKQSKKK